MLRPEHAIAALFHDCPNERVLEAAARLRPMNPAVGMQPLTGAAWRELPSTFVRCSRDRMPEIITAAFLASGPDVIALPIGHCPNWSRPELVADLLLTRVVALVSF